MTQSTSRSMSLNVDMQADLAQDRILLRIRYEQPVAWLLTRRLALRWVAAWIERLQAIDLPDLPPLFCGGMARDLRAEHELAIEPDPALPTVGHVSVDPTLVRQAVPTLLELVEIRVRSTDTLLKFRGAGLVCAVELTRRDSHRMLEFLVRKVRTMGWLDAPDLPSWLGELPRCSKCPTWKAV